MRRRDPRRGAQDELAQKILRLEDELRAARESSKNKEKYYRAELEEQKALIQKVRRGDLKDD